MAVTPHDPQKREHRRRPRRPGGPRGAAQRLSQPRVVRGRRGRVQLREPGLGGLHRPQPRARARRRAGCSRCTPTIARRSAGNGRRPSACAGGSRPSSACAAPTASTAGCTTPRSPSPTRPAGSRATWAPATTSASGATPSSRRARGRRRSGCSPTTCPCSSRTSPPTDLRCLFANKAYAAHVGLGRRFDHRAHGRGDHRRGGLPRDRAPHRARDEGRDGHLRARDQDGRRRHARDRGEPAAAARRGRGGRRPPSC